MGGAGLVPQAVEISDLFARLLEELCAGRVEEPVGGISGLAPVGGIHGAGRRQRDKPLGLYVCVFNVLRVRGDAVVAGRELAGVVDADDDGVVWLWAAGG